MEKWISFGKKLKEEIKDDRATGLAAEQAYYYMLSIFPILILLLSIVPYLSIDPQKAISFMQEVMPSETARVFDETVVSIVSQPNEGLLTIGILGTLWSASSGMNAFMHAMNVAFDVEETRSFIKARLVSIGLTVGLIVTFIIALVLPVFGNVLLNTIEFFIPLPGKTALLLKVLRWLIAIAVMIVILAVLYRLAPNKHYPFKHVIPGAVTATIIWQFISLGFSFYVSQFGNYSATYGSLGGVIILMLWFFLTGFALVLGGEINALYHKESTSTIPTSRDKAVSP
ncbi:YihY/virulence factor BrkB family protein [Priestia abyssalis]|uniref:YihY/virulence factor BrkB family protein n=1 Tax=Priestia abyssalis TaxID=1221450 RepID=UPI0009950ED0|nr:YihY/virulence factor BrkB family protein [Priestia abyssalis]